MGKTDLEHAEKGINMEALIREQKFLIESVQKQLANHKKDTADRRTVSNLKKRLEALERFAESFWSNHRRIMADVEDNNLYVQTSINDQFEEAYIEASSKIEETFRTMHPREFEVMFPGMVATSTNVPQQQQQLSLTQSVTSNSTSAHHLRLPKLNLPTFGGNSLEWPSFIDAFNTIDNDDKLSDAQKMQYLKGVLTGPAELLIRHLAITDANYRTALEELDKTYNNKRMIFMDQLNTFFGQPTITVEDQRAVQELLSVSRATLHGVQKLGATLESVFLHMILQKLPPDTRLFCLQSFDPKTIPVWDDLEKAIQIRINSFPYEEVKGDKGKTNDNVSSKDKATKVKHTKGTYHVTKDVTCPECDGTHRLRNCPQFLKMNSYNRRVVVEKCKRCFNCLGPRHRSDICYSAFRCRECGERHHTLLHPTGNTADKQLIDSRSNNQPSPVQSINHTTNPGHVQQILLATAIIRVKNQHGNFIKLRALLDQGSQASLITEAAVQRLGLKKTPIAAQINGVGAGPVNQCRFLTSLEFGSYYDKGVEVNTEAFILTRLTNFLPTYKIENHQSWEHIKFLQLADPEFMQPNHVDVLLGADVYARILRPGVVAGETGSPVAQNTLLGWILSGTIRHSHTTTIKISNFHTQVDVDSTLRKFWELEEIPAEKTHSAEDQWCEEFFCNTYQRKPNGRYTVQLPLKSHFEPGAVLGTSRAQAERRFQHLEARFKRNPEFYESYAAVINEYVTLGQMEPEDTTEKEYFNPKIRGFECSYLPHHPVIKESSSTTKLRVVFDASAKSTNKKSLNDILVTGPALQNDLIKIILTWRLHKFVFTCDIEKMYRRIEVHPRDTHYQQILWRDKPEEKLQAYRLNTVTFGTASAPFTAIRVMHQLAHDEHQKFPLAAAAIRNNMYVDDILSGGDDQESTVAVQNQLISCLKTGGFELRKWSSNSQQLLDHIPKDYHEGEIDFQIKSETCIKALGLYWNPVVDGFSYKINFSLEFSKFTKRNVLSTIARLFDPLGWVGPVVITAKIFLKQLWCEGLDWDDPIPDFMASKWRSYLSTLPEITQIKIVRWLDTYAAHQTCEFHTFCDGSMEAYSAAVYLKIQTETDVHVHLLMGKTKVTPKQRITVPRIELSAAVLAVKLHKYVRATFESRFQRSASYFWTDSTIVLSWIKGNPDRWKTFVCNRIHTILEGSNIGQWHHVRTSHNPADVSSRGVTPAQLHAHTLWWSGPDWLKQDRHEWPSSDCETKVIDSGEANPETKKSFLANTVIVLTNEIIHRFSSYQRLINITAWCLRFLRNSKLKNQTDRLLSTYVTTHELQLATLKLHQLTQMQEFALEIAALQAKTPLPGKSKLIGLTPFLDKDGILRVGGRLKNSSLHFSQKHPIILPRAHHFTELYIQHCHIICLHGGPQLTLMQIRKQCWILQGRRSVTNYIRKCHVCFKAKPIGTTQLMGNLPAARVRPSRPFLKAGVDYAGPIDIRTSKGRGNKSYKGYIAVFVCLSTKAVHLEVVSDLTSSAFLAALQRFFARRGLSSDLYSDCGTTFIGANNELQRKIQNTHKLFAKDIIPELTVRNINWHFIPPYSPHFGGLWEAGVKSMKHHLRRIIPKATLTFEELSTVLCKIEACLNSRPLCPISDYPEDFTAITPGHFLTGDALLAPPEESHEKLTIKNRWHLLQKIRDDFWKIWQQEYLSRFQLRPKWTKENHSVKVGDLVLIKQDNLPPQSWRMGRILEVHKGTDNLIRVVTLRTKDGVTKRPIVKICLLPHTASETAETT